MAQSRPRHPRSVPNITAHWLLKLFRNIPSAWHPPHGLLCLLGVPESKQQELCEQFGGPSDKALLKAIEWWLSHATCVSWRKIIVILDRANATEVADRIRANAELSTDPSLTLGNVKGALSRVLRWRDVGEWLFVPSAVLDQICVKYMKDMRASALAEYVVTFLPALTWEGIIAALHYCGEKKAMECVMPYVHTFPAPHLTLENIMPLIRRVCNWWRKQKWKRTSDSGLIHILGVPESEQNKFRKQSLCPTKAESKAIEWWLHHGSVSWRKLIHSLYEAEEFEVANDIRKYAEPPTDPTLTEENVRKVMKGMREWREVALQLVVPAVVVEAIDDHFPSDDEKRSFLADYLVNILPNITWEEIAVALYHWDEQEALRQAELYLHKDVDLTCSLSTPKIMEVVKGVRYRDLILALEVPTDKWSQDVHYYQNYDQCREAVVSHAVQTHPCLTWRRLSASLQKQGYCLIAQEVTRKYGKAPPLTLEHIMPLIWRVHNWHSRKNGLLTLLGISESKRQVVRELVGYDDNKVVPKCIEWWLHYGTFVSWRDLIYCLDRAGEVLVANDIREYAESQTDPTLTEKNVKKMLKLVQCWRAVWIALRVPLTVLDAFQHLFLHDHDKKIAFMAKYVVTIIPRMTWEDVVVSLYQSKEERAMAYASCYLQTVDDPSLTRDNIAEEVKIIPFSVYESVFDIPPDKFKDFNWQFKRYGWWYTETVLNYVLETHPCLSWERLSRNLKACGYTTEADEVAKKYMSVPAAVAAERESSLFHECLNYILKNYRIYQPLVLHYIPHHLQTLICREWEKEHGSLV